MGEADEPQKPHHYVAGVGCAFSGLSGQIMSTRLSDYSNFMRTYEGKGEFHFPDGIFDLADGTSFPCRFECGQTKQGKILCKCWFDDEEHCKSLISLITELFALRWNEFAKHSRNDELPYPYLLGFASERSIHVVMHPKYPMYFEAESALLFFARKLSSEANTICNAVAFKFAVANFVFEDDLPAWSLDESEVTITKVENYDETTTRLLIEGGTEITAEMSIEPAADDFQDLKRIEGIARDICRMLSLAKGCKIQWLFWEAVSDDGDVVNTCHWTPWMLPYTPLNILCDKLTPVHSNIWEFINECFSVFQKERREDNWGIEEAIDHYILAVLQLGFLELRGLSLVALIDFLTGRYADKHDMQHLLDKNSFNKEGKKFHKSVKELLEAHFSQNDVIKREGALGSFPEILKLMAGKYKELNRSSFSTVLNQACLSLNLNIEEEELVKVVKIRNKLVHTARFFDQGETDGAWQNTEDKMGQYSRIRNFVGCMLLAILEHR